MRYCKNLRLVLCIVFLYTSCSSDDNNSVNSASSKIPQESNTVALSIQNESSYNLSDVSWRGISFYSSVDGRTIPSGSIAKNSVEKDVNGYIFFTRCGTVPAKLRSRDVVSADGEVFRILDTTPVVEVGNTENKGTLADIKLSAPDYYIISFESNCGAYIEPYVVQRGKEITVAPVLQKEGASFVGWYEDEEFTQFVKFPYVPESDVVLHAEWKEPPKSVPFSGSRVSSTVKIQITPSDDKYFDHYRICCYQVFGGLATRTISRPKPSPPKLIKDFETKDLFHEITGLTEKYYSVELYVVDKFGQQSEKYSKSF